MKILLVLALVLGTFYRAGSYAAPAAEDPDDPDVVVDEVNENPAAATVIDPEVQEEMAREAAKGAAEADTAQIKTGKDEIKPNVTTLYVPKACTRKAQRGDLMVVHYTGWLAKSGRKFDTTIDVRRRYTPFEFVLGTGYVIRGWEKGLMGMCPGEKRRLEVPPTLGYGRKGLRGIIPANASLVFLVDLLDLRRATPNYAPIDLFTSLDKDNDQHLSREEISHYVEYQQKMYRHKNAPALTPEEHEKMVDDIMHKEDRDKDGKISHAEFSGPKSPKIEL